tara:strand:- start:73 stop:675 length:603 start_codon:yes stop_codon:yes gene_type:complete
MKIINKDPLIHTYDNFITDEECEFIINIAKDNLKRAKVSDDTIDISEYRGRTNSVHWVPLHKYDLMKKLCLRIAIEIDVPFKHFESFQIIHYTKGQEYQYHYDAYDRNDKEQYKKYCEMRGNRLKTVLCYLNDVSSGGGTGFDSIQGREEPLIVEPKKGRMILFQNVRPDGSLHKESRHAGLPVEDGEKWAFNLWVRERE